MKKILKIRVFIIFLTVLLISLALVNYPIFEITNSVGDDFLSTIKNDGNINVYLLEYHYTTGSGWLVTDSTNKDMINKEVVLCSAFDPRLLKDNDSFDLDYTAKLLVKSKKTVGNNGNIPVLFADEIAIVFNTNKTYYSIFDLKFSGIVKGILGVFNNKFRISY